MGYTKAKNWDGKDLKGPWEVTIKIDGVRALWDGEKYVSRNGKPLYNLPARWKGDPFDCEVYCGSFKETIEKTRAATKDRPIKPSEMFSLDPLDKRLHSGVLLDPTSVEIRQRMEEVVAAGYEGLVLRQGSTWLKVKPTETYDVPVTGIIEGTGKHKGRMGALMTPMGKVGTGFSDLERLAWWGTTSQNTIGKIIEVECMKLTPDGKFRHPRFVRIRPDK